MNAKTYFNAGDITQAINVTKNNIKNQPNATGERLLLSELLFINGDYERADQECELITNLDANAALQAALMRQLIRAQLHRQECFLNGRLPEVIGTLADNLKDQLSLLVAMRAEHETTNWSLTEQIDAGSMKITGVCNGKAFSGLRDLDDTTASFLEVLTSTGKYYWIAMHQIASIEFRPCVQPIDTILRRANLSITNGLEGEVYIPAIYIHTPPEDIEACLGLKTAWLGSVEAPMWGIGLREFLIGDEVLNIHQIEELVVTNEDNNV